MLGTFGVGKTSLVQRFVHNTFEEKYLSTIGVLINQKTLPPHENQGAARQEVLNLILWDIANWDKFDPSFKSYLHGAHGAIVVYDLTRPQSVADTEKYLTPFLELNPGSKIVFVANKSDLVDKNTLDLEQFLRFTKAYQSDLHLTSAKTGENIEEIFQKLGKSILNTE